MKNNKITAPWGKIICSALLIGAFYSCEIQENFEYSKSEYSEKVNMSAWEYIQSHDSLMMFEEAIKLVDLQSVYEAESKTFIAPTNAAFSEYLSNNSYSSLGDVPLPILKNAMKYHIVNDLVTFTDPDLAESNLPLPYATENGQTMYLSHNSNYEGLVNQETNKQWTIVTSNLEPTNGIIHVVSSIVYFSAAGDLSVPDPSVKTDTIFPLYDTFVNGGSASGRNYGADALLKVKNVTDNGTYDRKAFLMFDLNEFDEEGVITDLKFELAVKFTHAKGVALDLYEVKDTLWTEMGLTFNNATFPDNDPIASLTTTKVSTFNYDVTDYYNSLDKKQRVSFMLDGEAGSNETDEFGSKENTDFNPPMLIAIIASGDNVLELQTNTGFIVENGGAYAFNKEVLEVSGAASADIIYSVVAEPTHGWLVRGADILKVGDKFTQQDVDVMNLLYINDGTGSEDTISVSARDRAGSSLDAFETQITIQ
ncbi:DNRLRE domain-containing protein [Wenyingzhuangia sp. 2_MG-2023]|uniref:CBM96 family carbohydrate-binding protein n=1 Tax=Wenyingzhuangia sp. 2_MG-2023 TaxID=3062639 RepID=UPI0026E2A335|nr:DNRLRE domain-containing protein [Wenyingzhuangia sp. 2_MG-2023]MDO6738698.1 DNRLRE domain-containing protein [Wenyingzhuangia sp. 2_MG-2023]MDO6802365.1 DNRLRE domain-containing protein [Wenyingzhuangia sp. 1_MG-2023]